MQELPVRKDIVCTLDEFIIEGIRTTVPFHLQLLRDPRFVAGDFDTKFLERFELQPV